MIETPTAHATRPPRAGWPAAGWVAGALLALAPSARAAVVMDVPGVQAELRYRTGTVVGTVSHQREVVTPTLTTVADATLTLPDFTPPRGGPDDTFFAPATLDAYQDNRGFNTTRVVGPFANGRVWNSLTARTVWEVNFITYTSLLPFTEVGLDYLLFPGAVGLSRAGGYTGEAGVRYTISTLAGTVAEGSVVLRRQAGNPLPTLTSSGVFAGQALAWGQDIRNGLLHDTVRTDAFLGSALLGIYGNLEADTVRYDMQAWIDIPGYEVGGFAELGDPFALRSDADAEVQRVFVGLGAAGLGVHEVSPVPEPATAVLWLAGLVLLASTLPRRRARHVA